jgi:RNA polymerase sigma factor (sigma-70 family)
MTIGMAFEEVLVEARTGHDWALEMLYRDLAPGVIGYLRTQGASGPEELAAEVFSNAVRNLPRFDGDEERFRAWVFSMAHRMLLEDQESRLLRGEHLTDPQHLAGALAAWDRQSPEVHTFKRVGTRWAAEALLRLPPDERAALLLHLVGGLPVPRVASVLGKTVPATTALEARAVGTLARKVEEDGVS